MRSGDEVARKRASTYLRIAPLVCVLLACAAKPGASGIQQLAQKEASAMNSATTLEGLLESADWEAVEEAQREGPLALPAVRRYAHSSNYRSRQIATACAARIGGDEATEILASGLADSNVNVQLTAAKELSSRPFPAAGPKVLDTLASTHQDAVVRQLLALAAG